MSAALAIPDPTALDLATVGELGDKLVAWAESTDDLGAVRDAAARWGAITEYVRRTSREGVADAEAALRRLEVRIGRLLGPARLDHDRRRGATSVAPDLERHARQDLRILADHPDVVEQVIAESNDASPPSRRKILTAISRKRSEIEDEEFASKVRALDPAKVQAAFASSGWQPSGDRLTVQNMAFAVVITIDDRSHPSAEAFGPFASQSEIEKWVAGAPASALVIDLSVDSVSDPRDAWWLEGNQ